MGLISAYSVIKNFPLIFDHLGVTKVTLTL